MSSRNFRQIVWNHWRKNGRHSLSWRRTKDPYRILVSEVMLQQTQVHRVISKYKEFLKAFPSICHLARSHLADVLRVWSGLGYNRRAKFLRDAAVQIVEQHGGQVPCDYEKLRALPGVGDYTARAICVFASNEPNVLIETNIRTVFIQHFYKGQTFVEDKDILPIAREAAEGQNPRTWHWALMDYGSHLKRSGVRVNAQSAHYTKQSRFEGSLRQIRAAILRALANDEGILDLRNPNVDKFDRALASLARDGLIVKKKGKWRIA